MNAIGNVPEAPGHYDDERREIWAETVARLTAAGGVLTADPEVVNTYVEAVRSHRQASRLLAQTNVLVTRDGKVSENPALAVQRKAAADMARASRALGLNQAPAAGSPPVNDSPEQRPVKPWDRRQLCRELAEGEIKRADLARKYGLGRSAITEFAKRHAREIDDIRAQLDDEFAGLWIAQKAARIAAYQSDLEQSAEGEYAGHYEQIRTRTQILRAVAEELGQLPPRATVAVVPVVHVLEGVDPNLLK